MRDVGQRPSGSRTGQLSEIASMPAVRGGSTAVTLADGSVLVVGGLDVSEVTEDTPGCVPVTQRS
jgi:hypothetical protein